MPRTLSLIATFFAVFFLVVTGRGAELAAAADGPTASTEGRQSFPKGHPNNPETWYAQADLVAKQANDKRLSPDAANALVLRALEVNEKALALNPVYYEALILKSVLLRQRAAHEKDPALQKKLIDEAVVCSAKAKELAKRGRGER